MSASSESAGLYTRGIDSNRSPLHANFIRKAQICAVEGNVGEHTTSEGEELNVDDVYVVWFAKTLQNWKALVSTDAISGHYWEVTYNGDKQETYINTYLKEGNIVLEDQFFNAPQSR